MPSKAGKSCNCRERSELRSKHVGMTLMRQPAWHYLVSTFPETLQSGTLCMGTALRTGPVTQRFQQSLFTLACKQVAFQGMSHCATWERGPPDTDISCDSCGVLRPAASIRNAAPDWWACACKGRQTACRANSAGTATSWHRSASLESVTAGPLGELGTKASKISAQGTCVKKLVHNLLETMIKRRHNGTIHAHEE